MRGRIRKHIIRMHNALPDKIVPNPCYTIAYSLQQQQILYNIFCGYFLGTLRKELILKSNMFYIPRKLFTKCYKQNNMIVCHGFAIRTS